MRFFEVFCVETLSVNQAVSRMNKIDSARKNVDNKKSAELNARMRLNTAINNRRNSESKLNSALSQSKPK